MKKLITTLVFGCIICTAFAQQSFKQIHFTFVIDTYPQNKLKAMPGGGYEKSDEIGQGEQRSMAKGTIDINAKDSVITINNSPVSSFKILGVEPEKTTAYDDHTMVKNLTFDCVNKANSKLCFIKILRQTQPGAKNVMNVLLKYDANTFTTYTCDYLKEL
jgi:hypothetical protein